MSNHSPQTTGQRASRPARPRTKSARSKAVKPARPSAPKATGPITATAPSPDVEALRALLADPETIVSGTSPGRSARHAEPLSAPTSATTRPVAKSRALPKPGRSASTKKQTQTKSPATAETNRERARSPRPALLDATRAQRLAREARLRERESREALARARETYEPAPRAVPTPSAPTSPTAPSIPTAEREEGAGWQRIALSPRATVRPTPSAAPIAAPAAERALAAELREARATLAIARETTLVQRDELARLREALADARNSLATRPPVAEASENAREATAELAGLRDRIALLERESEQSAAERQQLLHTIAGHEDELALRARRLESLTERFEVQEQALDQARRQWDQERRRHTEAQALLERLRGALRGVEPEATERPATVLEIVHVDPSASTASSAQDASAQTSPTSSTTLAPTPAAESAVEPSTGPAARAPIFEFWRGEQIRRNFGPVGIDGVADLLRQPLEQRATRGDEPLAILVVGRGAAAFARVLAEDLMRGETTPFVLHLADPIASDRDRRIDEDPLRDSLRPHPAPETPAALAALLSSISPAVVLCRDFLTWQAEADPWLAALEGSRARGACLVFLEETGQGEIAPSAEIATVGQRIWELLPERYTLDPKTGRSIARFRDAFARRPAAPRNGLLQRLRQHFELELCAQFGFLAEAFVSGPIAGCFDVRAARDQRFLKQIADLDERRLESGSATALHLVARVDPQPER